MARARGVQHYTDKMKLKEKWKQLKIGYRILIVTTAVVTIVALLIAWGYYLHTKNHVWAPWTGFGEFTDPEDNYHRAKTLWDVMELLIVPAALALIALLFNRAQREKEIVIEEKRAERELAVEEKRIEAERAIEAERFREAALQSYLDQMTHLMLTERLRDSGPNSEVRHIARVRTLTALAQLDGSRKATVLQFLYDAGLIIGENPVIGLHGANLSECTLYRNFLDEAQLSGANFRKSIFADTYLRRSNLQGTHLTEASFLSVDLKGADLQQSDLVGAHLTMVNLQEADLRGSKWMGPNPGAISFKEAFTDEIAAELVMVDLTGAIWDSQTRWPEGFDPTSVGAVLVDELAPKTAN